MRVFRNFKRGHKLFFALGIAMILVALFPELKAKPNWTVGQSEQVKQMANKASPELVDWISFTYKTSRDKAAFLGDEAMKISFERNLDPSLVLAVMATESSFDESAVSSMGAVGLMQVRLSVHEKRFERHGGNPLAFDPSVNMTVGADILAGYLKKHDGDVVAALQGYNGNSKSTRYSMKVLNKKAVIDTVI